MLCPSSSLTKPHHLVRCHTGVVIAGARSSQAWAVAVQDRFGRNVVDAWVLHAAIASDDVEPASAAINATLQGITSAPTIGGLAVFSDCWLLNSGKGWRLTFAAPANTSISPVASSAFSVTFGSAVGLRVERAVQRIEARGALGQDGPIVSAIDTWGNVAKDWVSNVDVDMDASAAVFAAPLYAHLPAFIELNRTLLGENASECPRNGSATFDAIRVLRAGSGYRFLFASANFSRASSRFSVARGPPSDLYALDAWVPEHSIFTSMIAIDTVRVVSLLVLHIYASKSNASYLKRVQR